MSAPRPEPAAVLEAVRAPILERCGASVVLLATLTGPDGPGARWRWRGLHITPTRRILALPGWRDAVEGVLPEVEVAWLAMDVDKGLRHLLRQSLLMLELVGAARYDVQGDAAGARWRDELLQLLPGAVTAGAVATYRAAAQGLLRAAAADPACLPPALRLALTGLCLADTGVVEVDAGALGAWAAQDRRVAAREASALLGADAPLPERVEALLPLLEQAEVDTALPRRPSTYDALSAWLVRLRLAGPAAGL